MGLAISEQAAKLGDEFNDSAGELKCGPMGLGYQYRQCSPAQPDIAIKAMTENCRLGVWKVCGEIPASYRSDGRTAAA